MYDAVGVRYLYTMKRDVVLEPTCIGRRMSYVKHSRARTNLVPKLFRVCGSIRIDLFPARELTPGKEYTCYYGYDVIRWQECLAIHGSDARV